MDNQFMLFLETVDERFQDFVTQINKIKDVSVT